MEILKISENVGRRIKEALEKGKMVVVPTDTVYGLVCDATNASAIDRIFKIKNRAKEKPVGVFVKNIKMAKQIAQINEKQQRFLKKLGKNLSNVTFILKKKKELPVGTEKTIGIRIPDFFLINKLFEQIDFPIAQTSANISGKPATTEIEQVLKQFRNQALRPGLVIDAGDLPKAKPSTVLDLTGKKPKILREGEIEVSLLGG